MPENNNQAIEEDREAFSRWAAFIKQHGSPVTREGKEYWQLPAPWPPLTELSSLAAAASELAEVLRHFPARLSRDDPIERAHLATIRLSIEPLVLRLAELLNPLKLPLRQAPPWIAFRDWADRLRLHYSELHLTIKRIVEHFGFHDLYEQRAATGEGYERSLGSPDEWLIQLLDNSAKGLAGALTEEEARERTPAVGSAVDGVTEEPLNHAHTLDEPRSPYPTDEGEKDRRRPCYDRDHLWRQWAEEGLGLAAIRDLWNERYNQYGGEPIGKGRSGMDTVKTALKKARKEREEENR
jgi:hypothetical protein